MSRPPGHPALSTEAVAARLKGRYRAERRFRIACLAAVVVAIAFLALLFVSIVGEGYSAFTQTHIALDIHFDPETLDPAGRRDPDDLAQANYSLPVRSALSEIFPEATGRSDQRELYGLISTGATFELQDMVTANPSILGETRRIWLLASDDADMLVKGSIPRDVPETERRVSDRQIAWLDELAARDSVERRFNTRFFTTGDSREPEMAGIWGAVWEGPERRELGQVGLIKPSAGCRVSFLDVALPTGLGFRSGRRLLGGVRERSHPGDQACDLCSRRLKKRPSS